MKNVISLLLFWLIYFSGTPFYVVYVCRSPNAHVYHIGYCKGLDSCTHGVDQMTVEEAVRLGYKRPCKYCY